ncbi:tyrosine--tRNA ligase [Mycoplasma tauri]|uniref:Tyrosine--tRNA ligase n=1 Tax=Mycoplasma tauri TaxID=547987 RepID=A0A953NC93_9MOLU|nr:tyrosine--tRNA ligase [Mycoplasma tauri]MBZ4195207.1 tyrosine--tRNA ligase [Mycoplasma tauri]MBZ4203419.1 tyrosine--tRNA ligase [Mycoplasma tauri]MBZ4204031.1 tyrosine--tRNA ligase [Mycoplasma tauri]MBZ4212752.1 tyrosine--tRNA ligase [Mycoplasma tauri]MBZ4217980.1 tyrosine--tRNA ligase [Mycoplasma tauri]
MDILKDLENRKILKNISNRDKFLSLDPNKTGVYVGFDPTAESLHLGNYILISILKRFAKFGYKVYALIGGATGMIGDPSFRDSERVLLKDKEVEKNKLKIKAQLESFGLEVIDNYYFYKNINVIDFLRDTGKLINVAYMMAKDSVQKRIERGLSFTEFSYQVLQGNDFLHVYKNNDINIQVGGSDQWGNITSGLDMISRVFGDNHKAVGLTTNLLVDESGKKIGKSFGGGSLWLDKNMCSPYKMYQYLLTQPDSKVGELINWLTFLDTSEIDKILREHFEDPSKQKAQKILASEIVKDIFGEKELVQAQNITSLLFDKNFDVKKLTFEDLNIIQNYLPTYVVKENDLLIQSLINQKLFQSNREAKEFINNKALKIDDIDVNLETIYQPKNYDKKFAFFKKGKKQIVLIKTFI